VFVEVIELDAVEPELADRAQRALEVVGARCAEGVEL
jgi:hypothetical protein